MINTHKLFFDMSIYDIDAIENAAYRSSNFFTVILSKEDNNFQCDVTPNIGVNDEQFRRALEEFKKEILDQQLRLKLKAETEPVRNLILGIAFSNTGLQSNE